MRILYLADAVFKDLPGGSKMLAWELAVAMARRGHQVTFLVPAQTPDALLEEETEGIRIIRYPGGHQALRFIQAGRAACARLWERGPFDVVHTHFAYAALGPLRSVPPSIPRVRTFHGFWDEEGWVQETRFDMGQLGSLKASVKRRLRARVEDDNLRHSDALVTISDYSARLLRERGMPARLIRVLPPGIDAGRFVPPSDQAALRRSLGLPTDRRILLSVRRLVPRMGMDNLIRAVPEIVACTPDVLLLIGGQGPERARLEALVTASHLEDHVRLLGFIPEERLAAFYQAADLFVLPTVALEGFGLVILEAMACGVPVVGTPVGAIPEILAQVDPDLISGDTTPASLARAICRFLGEGRGQTLTGVNLHNDVCRRYSWETHADQMQSLYLELQGRRLVSS